jgi:hypothetical protein
VCLNSQLYHYPHVLSDSSPERPCLLVPLRIYAVDLSIPLYSMSGQLGSAPIHSYRDAFAIVLLSRLLPGQCNIPPPCPPLNMTVSLKGYQSCRREPESLQAFKTASSHATWSFYSPWHAIQAGQPLPFNLCGH